MVERSCARVILKNNDLFIKKDHVCGGFIAFSSACPIIAQGETIKESLDNLELDLKILEEFKKLYPE